MSHFCAPGNVCSTAWGAGSSQVIAPELNRILKVSFAITQEVPAGSRSPPLDHQVHEGGLAESGTVPFLLTAASYSLPAPTTYVLINQYVHQEKGG